MGQVVDDPQITIGPYRVLKRTDGKFFLHDERLPAGYRTAAVRSTKEAIVAEGERLVALGSPVVAVDDQPAPTTQLLPSARVFDDGGERKRARRGARTPDRKGAA